MKNLVELIGKVRVEESKLFGITVCFEMKPTVNNKLIGWKGDYISVYASPIYTDLFVIYPEDVEEGEKVNLEILRDLTGLSKSEILKELETLEEIWIEKLRDIKSCIDIELTAFETEIGGEF